MPTILRVGPYRFFFYAGDRYEPPHVHVERDDNAAKIWLEPLRLQHSIGFHRVEINRIIGIAEENRDQLLKEWEEFFND